MTKAYVDKLIVGLGGYCGAGAQGHCDPGLRVWGHCDDGRDVAFTILLRDEEGDIVAHSDPILSQRGDGVHITSGKNLGPPWRSCDLLIPTRGAGGYSLSHHLHGVNDLRGRDVTWLIQVVASPVEWITTPNGYPLQRKCLDEWNWDSMMEAPLRVYYQYRQYRCDEATVGELPFYGPPTISNIICNISNDEAERGYARVSVGFETDIEARGRVYYSLFLSGEEGPCDPFAMWHSPASKAGLQHTVTLSEDTLWYVAESPKKHCFKIVAWPSRYRWVEEARGYSEKHSFTLPHE